MTPEELPAFIAGCDSWYLQTLIEDKESSLKSLMEHPPLDGNIWKAKAKHWIKVLEQMTDEEYRRKKPDSFDFDSRYEYLEFLRDDLREPPIDWPQVVKTYELAVSLAKAELARRGEL